jgi:solute carrier family 25 iron transporter 28/37
MVGCIPAHALYFSSYEFVKYSCRRQDGTLPYWAGLLAGAAAVLGHDVIMTPLDTVKQRLQLGHYSGMKQAVRHMVRHEGTFALYRSFPVTLLTNIPYGSIMVSTNEICKDYLSDGHGQTPTLTVCLISSSAGGFAASFFTTPLDRIKTVLQTQHLQPAYCERYGACPKVSPTSRLELKQAVAQILKQEGVAGLFRGSLPRILSHTPAVAISWTAYESAKKWLAQYM